MALSRPTTSRFTGLRAWWMQRLSAVYLLLFLVVLLVSMAILPPQSAASWRGWLSQPGVTVAVLVFFAALLIHMWVGLRDVLLDYARPAAVRNLLLALVAVGLLGMGAWMLAIMLRLHG